MVITLFEKKQHRQYRPEADVIQFQSHFVLLHLHNGAF
jgi:hypothetical protein